MRDLSTVSYYAAACGHQHATQAQAAECEARGFDIWARAPYPVVAVWLRPGRITLTQVVAG